MKNKKKVLCLCTSALLLAATSAFAQGEMDAYKFSQTDLNGTARYLGMGGAFGALGGDISAMSTNPAGLGIYRSSELVTSISLSANKAKTNWAGTQMEQTQTKFRFDNIAYVGYFPTGKEDGLVSFNVGFSYNRVKNFDRKYQMGRGAGGYSISDYIADYANLSNNPLTGNGLTGNDLWSTDNYNPYLSQDWLPTLGYNSGIIDSDAPNKAGTFFSPFGEYDDEGNWKPLEVQAADMYVHERGGIDQYNFSLAGNISNIFYIGATVAISDLKYKVNTYYDEDFGYFNQDAVANNFRDQLYWDNYSSTNGTGYGFNVGVIVRPTDYLRFGVAYNSPTWYKLTQRYYGEAGAFVYDYYYDKENPLQPNDPDLAREATTPTDFYTDYKMRSADRWIFSAAAVIGRTALVSVDYELKGYKNMHLQDRDGRSQDFDNQLIKEDFRMGNMLKIGTEIKLTPQFAFRLGYTWEDSPFKDHMKHGNTLTEVYPIGTRTAYSIDKSISHYTAGLGYRFTPNFYADLACVYRVQKEEVYPFPNLINDGEVWVESIPANLKYHSTKFALTVGYKF